MKREKPSTAFDVLRFPWALQYAREGITMDESWKRWMAAMLLSLVLPRLMVTYGSRLQYSQPVQAETAGTTVATEEFVTVPPQTGAIHIPVLMPEGDVEQMTLEDYIRGVVLAEMPASFEDEALKAQAVAARTYALRRLTLGDRHTSGAICTESTCCQAWMSDTDYLTHRGTRKEWTKIYHAVAETAGQVLTYNGKLAETTYFSCSGGRTEDALAVWGEEIPYLQSVASPGEEQASVYRQQLFFAGAEFAAALGRSLSGSPTDWLGKVTQTPGGGVATMVIGGITYSGVELRKLLSLNSTSFTMTAEENGITVTVLGNGHRVGLSQYGADAMAATGCSFTDILAHYYQGTKIDKYSDLG